MDELLRKYEQPIRKAVYAFKIQDAAKAAQAWDRIIYIDPIDMADVNFKKAMQYCCNCYHESKGIVNRY